ncbi:MAG: methyltransferase domain-containing protein [Sphingomonadaceae bacterium]|nr:methyltransferase domain-containing protein [Sphingomonadaceae bacterium]
MQPLDHPPEIFDRNRRRVLRERAVAQRSDAFLWQHVADELSERLAIVTRRFDRALVIGPLAAHADHILGNRKSEVTPCCIGRTEQPGTIIADEDRLPFAEGSFDLVISGGVLDSVNDLPGSLVQIRRILQPDGLFLGHMFGAGSLFTLKALLMAAEGDRASPHIHPQIDLRNAADLMQRAGFALPVADGDIMAVRYGDWRSIVSDIRAAGIGNALAGSTRYLGKTMPNRIDEEWSRLVDIEGRVEEHFAHIFLSGWAPAPNQPRPARRGSGELSLASALGPKSKS